MKKNPKRSNILWLGLVSFFNDISSEMIMPILPMFIVALGGGGIIVGLVGGLRDSIASILKVIFGYWSDKTGKRKVFVFGGYIVSIVFKLFLSFSKIWQHILVFASFERIGKGLRTASRDAIIADSIPEKRGKGFGIHRAMDTLGAIIGSVFVFLLFWFFRFSFKTIIFTAAIIACFSLLPLFFVKEEKRNPQNVSLKVSLKNLPHSLKLFILVSGIFSLANFSYMFFILRAKEIFEGKLSIGAPILLYILFNIFYALFAIPLGELSDKIGRKRVIVGGWLLFSFVGLGFAFFHSLSIYLVLFALYGIVYALLDGNQRAYVSDLSTEEFRATALGTFHTVIGVVALPASLIAGFLWQVNPAFTFIYGAGISLLASGIFFAFG
ncbi:MFS transporter [bacterium]|nr:MFS transporter [bacterium]